MDIQSVFNEYKAVAYMRQYFSKTEGQCSRKKLPIKTFRTTCIIKSQWKQLPKFTQAIECFPLQEVIYHILPEIKLCRIFPAVYFVTTSLPEEIVNFLKENLRNYPLIAQIFSKNQIRIVIWKKLVHHSVMDAVF